MRPAGRGVVIRYSAKVSGYFRQQRSRLTRCTKAIWTVKMVSTTDNALAASKNGVVVQKPFLPDLETHLGIGECSPPVARCRPLDYPVAILRSATTGSHHSEERYVPATDADQGGTTRGRDARCPAKKDHQR
jgi:hypothetical protein